MQDLPIFTKEELRHHDGHDSTILVAYRGLVYDVSTSHHWRRGTHHYRHHAGQDLTAAMKDAPHDADLLEKFPVVGRLAEE